MTASRVQLNCMSESDLSIYLCIHFKIGGQCQAVSNSARRRHCDCVLSACKCLFVLIVQEVEHLKRRGLTLFAVRVFFFLSFFLIIRCCLIFHAQPFKVELAAPAAVFVQTIKHRLDSAQLIRSAAARRQLAGASLLP